MNQPGVYETSFPLPTPYQNPTPQTSTNSETEGILVYIDNSNIFINTQKYAANLLKFGYGITQDWRARADVGKLVSLAQGNRELVRGKLYGSEPPCLDTVWKAIRMKKIEVSHSARSQWNSREKQTDTELTADAVEDIIKFSLQSKHDREGVVAFFTGDSDMLPPLRTALKYNLAVQVWSFRVALADELVRESKKAGNRMTIHYIDDHFNEIAYWAYYWNKRLPMDRTIVLTYENLGDISTRLESAAKESTRLFKMPTMGKYIEGTSLAILPIFNQLDKRGEKKYDFNRDIWCYASQLQEATHCVEIKPLLQLTQEYLDVEDEDALSHEVEADPEVDDEGFIPVLRKEKRKSQQFSDHCRHRFRCIKGKNCSYKHSEIEKEYFKEQQNERIRRHYKTRPCVYHTTKTCKYAQKSYLCSHAHDVIEAVCIRCQAVGSHWTDECPLPVNR